MKPNETTQMMPFKCIACQQVKPLPAFAHVCGECASWLAAVGEGEKGQGSRGDEFLQGGAASARRAHNAEVAGEIPAPATSFQHRPACADGVVPAGAGVFMEERTGATEGPSLMQGGKGAREQGSEQVGPSPWIVQVAMEYARILREEGRAA